MFLWSVLGERCVMSLGTMSDTTNTGMDARENLSLIEFSRVIDFLEPDTFTRGSVTCLGNFYLGCFVLCCFVYMEVKPLESFRTREIKAISFFMAQALC